MMVFCHGGSFPGGFLSGRQDSACLLVKWFFDSKLLFLAGFLHDGLSPDGFLSKRLFVKWAFYQVAKIRVAFVGLLKSVTQNQ